MKFSAFCAMGENGSVSLAGLRCSAGANPGLRAMWISDDHKTYRDCAPGFFGVVPDFGLACGPTSNMV